MATSPKLRFFPTLAAWRAWLAKNHASESELLVGLYKRDSGKPSITWPESVDGALCYGWIDGVRHRIDDESYSTRFTPRKARSFWSNVNIKRAGELIELGLMQPAGLAAFNARSGERSGVYAFEQASIRLDPESERRFRANRAAWKFFEAQPPWYRRTATWWVINAKREETKLKRLNTLIHDSEEQRTLRQLTRKPADVSK